MTVPKNLADSVKEPLSNVSFIYDLELRQFTVVHDSLRSLVGNTVILPEFLFKQIHTDDLKCLKKCFDELVNGGQIESQQFRITINGTELWLRLTPLIVQFTGHPVIFANVSDITAEVQNTYTIFKYANKKNSILNMLSHDLRGPLGVAQNLALVLEEQTSDRKLTGAAKSISIILKNAIDLISDLTSREFRETMDAQVVKQNINIARKTWEYMDECRRSQDLAGRSLVFKSSRPEIYVDLDEAKFMQVYNNLLSNALKFTREGGQISLAIEDYNNHVSFIFQDNGIGIPEKFLPILFDEFTDARRPGLNGEPTIGLGLSIIKTIVEWHGGIITVESKENVGTTFYIEIPKN